MPSGAKKTFLTRLTDTRATDAEGVGCLRWEGNKCYKWILYNNGAGTVTSVAGYFAYYYGVSGDAGDGDGYEDSTVTMDYDDSFGVGAGVFQVEIADGEYGWIQIQGPATLAIAAEGGADGNAMTAIGINTDGELDVSALVTDYVCAIVTDITAKLYALDCPF